MIDIDALKHLFLKCINWLFTIVLVKNAIGILSIMNSKQMTKNCTPKISNGYIKINHSTLNYSTLSQILKDINSISATNTQQTK